MEAMEARLKDFFGFSAFRPFQKEVIEQIMLRRDCLVVMATGSGKSICYQLPPLLSRKTAIVISPLISLMQDQVMGLKMRGIKAEHLSSAQMDHSVQSKVEEGGYDILYMTPERACSWPATSWAMLLKRGVSLLAVDEAHCISEWGHDFRTEYKHLDSLRPMLPGVPFVALTATATHKVREDIAGSLKLKAPYVALSSFDRPNLFYGVKLLSRTSSFRDQLAQNILNDLRAGPVSIIIYCATIKDVEEVAESLSQAGVNVRAYHSKLGLKYRESAHRSFLKDETNVIVATVAFGMGIDKPDIRKVIHYGCPKSMEAYYQESGRCGRDGLPSECWLYYARSDFTRCDFYASEARTEKRKKAVAAAFVAAQEYCSSVICRRKYILQYFGETMDRENCGKCDNCIADGGAQHRDMAQEAYLLLTAVKLCGGNWGMNMPIDVLRGSLSKKIVDKRYNSLFVHGLGRHRTANWWKALGDLLLPAGYLTETTRNQYRFLSVSAKGEEFLGRVLSGESLVLPVTDEMTQEELKSSNIVSESSAAAPGSVQAHQGLSEMELKLYNHLYNLRAELAKRKSTAPYMVCSEKTLQRIAKVRPSTMVRLHNIEGINQWLVTEHGEEILDHVKKISEGMGLQTDSSDTMPSTALRGDASKITSAKADAWKMWQERGMCFKDIANSPERIKPIKEETVIEYVLECIRAGYKADWERLCRETGLTQAFAEEIRVATEKLGSTDKLKPIKELLSESISYTHIKVFLLQQDLQRSKAQEVEVVVIDDEHGDTKHRELQSDGTPPAKKICTEAKEEATDEDLMNWLASVNGATLEEMKLRFSNTEASLSALVENLQENFVIYKKGDKYLMM